MSKAGDAFVEAFDKFLDEVSIADAMSVATGLFVGLIVSYVEQRGEDANSSITIDGGNQRDITIHAPKGEARAPTWVPNALFPTAFDHAYFVKRPLAAIAPLVNRALANPECYRSQTTQLRADIERVALQAGMADAFQQLRALS